MYLMCKFNSNNNHTKSKFFFKISKTAQTYLRNVGCEVLQKLTETSSVL